MSDWYQEMTDPTAGAVDPAFERLLANVGRLLFSWSLLEDALIEDIRRLRTEGGGTQGTLIRVRGSFSERLAEWQALLSLKSRRNSKLAGAVTSLAREMEQLRQIRNMVADQFAGASAGAEEPEPYILCSQGDRGTSKGALKRLTLSELSNLIARMDRCRRMLQAIGSLELPAADPARNS